MVVVMGCSALRTVEGVMGPVVLTAVWDRTGRTKAAISRKAGNRFCMIILL
jgi:hypothetical protein